MGENPPWVEKPPHDVVNDDDVSSSIIRNNPSECASSDMVSPETAADRGPPYAPYIGEKKHKYKIPPFRNSSVEPNPSFRRTGRSFSTISL